MAGSLKEVEARMVKAETTLLAARILAEAHLCSDSVSRSYYAMFYAAKAAVVHEGVRASKHSAVIAAFGRLFAKTGRVDVRWHKALSDAFEDRHNADYDIEQSITESDANREIKQASEFISAVRGLDDGLP